MTRQREPEKQSLREEYSQYCWLRMRMPGSSFLFRTPRRELVGAW